MTYTPPVYRFQLFNGHGMAVGEGWIAMVELQGTPTIRLELAGRQLLLEGSLHSVGAYAVYTYETAAVGYVNLALLQGMPPATRAVGLAGLLTVEGATAPALPDGGYFLVATRLRPHG